MPENAAVLADAQFGMVRILRPYANFEDDYEGVNAQTPVMVTEKGRALDAQAQQGVTGYDSNLLRGIPTPVGARVILWLPFMTTSGETPVPYRWTFWWRFRNVHDNRQVMSPYHYPKQGDGVPDTTDATSPARVVIPACNQGVVYIETEPAAEFDRVTQSLRSEDLNVATALVALPLVPGGGTGVLQQGILDPTTYGASAINTKYLVHEFSAVGDELLIGLSRSTDAGTNWGFADGSPDDVMSDLLGKGQGTAYPDVGVYVLVGAAP